MKNPILAMLGDCTIVAMGLRDSKLHSFCVPEGKVNVFFIEDALFIEADGQKFEVKLKKVKI